MLNYIVRRLLLLPITLLGTTLVVFGVMAASPGGVGGSELNDEGALKGREAQAAAEFRNRRYGLDRPLAVQYWRWVDQFLPIGDTYAADGSATFHWLKWPDLGESASKGRPIWDLVAERLPVTLLLSLISLPISHAIAIVTGIAAARRRGGVVDVGSAYLFMGLWSVPVILAGVLMIGFLANRQYVHLFPTSGLHDLQADAMPFLPTRTAAGWDRGWLLDTAWHLVLPVACLSYTGFAVLSRLVRGSMLENFAADFARTARAKGATENAVVYRHVFRNSLLPLITSSAGLIPGLFSGALVTEQIFSIQGMGSLMIEAVRAKDRDLILDQTLIVGGIGLLCYLAADLLYVAADPRVSYE